MQDVEASYYKSQNQQLRTLLRHAGLSELQEFQLIAALSEETAKAADINMQVNNDETSEDGRQTMSNGAIDKENDQTNIILDLSTCVENSASDGQSSSSMSLRKRPGNILSLTKQVVSYDQNVLSPGSEFLTGGWTKNHVNANELFDVPPDIKQFLRQKMIEIVYRNSSSIFLQLTNALTQQPKVAIPEMPSEEQNDSNKAGEKSQVLDLSTLNQIKIGGKVVRLAPVKQGSRSEEQLPRNVNALSQTVASKTKETESLQVIESETPEQELSKQSEDQSSAQTTDNNVGLKVNASPVSSQQPSFIGDKVQTSDSLNTPSVSVSSCENRVSQLPSIFSIAHLDDDNNKVPTLEEIDTQLQADVSLENAIRSSTLFDIDSLIANNEDSNPYAMNTSDSFDPRDQGESDLLRSETVLQESVPYDSSSVFSIRNLTNELYETQAQSQRYTSNVDVPVNRTGTETEPRCKPKQAVEKGRKDASVSGGKASAHSVEAMIMPARGMQHQSEANRVSFRGEDISDRSRAPVTVKGGKELRYLVEDIQSSSLSSSSSKRKLVFETEKSISGARNDGVLGSESAVKKQKLTTNATENSHVDKIGTFSSTGNQYGSTHQTLVANGPLPFWEENMVVMPPHGYSNSFTSSQNTFAYPVTPQTGREAINQYNGAYYGSNYYESGNSDYSSSSISNYRPSQSFMIPPGLSSGYSNESSEPGKYFNTPTFSNFNQPLGSTFNYNSSSSSTQQPLEPEMLLQPLTPNEKWNTFRQSSSFSGFKDVEFMARNSAGTSSTNNTQSSSQSTFNPFLEPSSSQPFAVDPTQYQSSFQYSFPYPPPLTEKPSQAGQSRRGVHEKQSQRESTTSGQIHRSSYQSSSVTTKSGSDARRGNVANSASNSSQSSSAPRHLIKNFVQSKQKTLTEPSSDRREGIQTSKTASGIQPHPPSSNANQFSWNSPSMEPFSISSSNFLFSNTELPF